MCYKPSRLFHLLEEKKEKKTCYCLYLRTDCSFVFVLFYFIVDRWYLFYIFIFYGAAEAERIYAQLNLNHREHLHFDATLVSDAMFKLGFAFTFTYFGNKPIVEKVLIKLFYYL